MSVPASESKRSGGETSRTYLNLPAERLATIVDLIPAIGQLREDVLRTAAQRTWCLAWERSEYDDLHLVPEAPGVRRGPLLTHVNAVNDRVAEVIAIAGGAFGVDVDREVALCAAILHDVDKPLLWRVTQEGGTEFIEGRTGADHGVIGADLARQCGVPENVARIVLGHSMFARRCEERRSPEAVVLHHSDLMASSFAALAAGEVPYPGRVYTLPC